MTVTITHNIDKVINRLTAYQRRDLPRAARRTVSQLGFQLARRDVPQYMKSVFDSPNNFTLRSLEYNVVSDYEVHLVFKRDVGKGNDPARYLEPVNRTTGGRKPAYRTKFTRFVHAAGIAPRDLNPVPFKPNLSKNKNGKVSQGEYSKVWRGLQKTTGAGKTGRGFRYFSVPDMRNRSGIGSRQGSLFDLPQGIYRAKGRGKAGVQLLFTYTRKPKPTVPQLFDYRNFVEKSVRTKVDSLLIRNLR